jgi:hypothetical protein
MRNLEVAQLVQARIWCADSEQAAVNTLWYVVAAIGSPAATDQDVADNLDTIIAAHMKAVLAATATYRGVQVQIFSGMPVGLIYPALFASVFINSSSGPGVAGAIGLPRQTCGLIEYQTDIPGRQGRGRSYIPFPASADNDVNGVPTAGYLTNLAFVAGDMGSGLAVSGVGGTATLVRVIPHLKKNKAGNFVSHTPITNASGSASWATQRRRGSFGRANSSPI